MSTAPAPARKGEWLEAWDPENEQTWDKSLAWKTLWITTFCLTLAFIAWFLPSAIIPKLNALGYTFTRASSTGWPRCPVWPRASSGSSGWCCHPSWAPARWSR
jgi:hypothetical protein